MKIHIHKALLASFLVASLLHSAENPPPATPTNLPFQNTSLPFEKRVEDLVGRMTVDEKISQLMMRSVAIPRLGVHSFYWWSEALHGVAGRGIATVFTQAIGLALKAGNDLCSGTTYQALPEALKLGLVDEKDLDRALIRLFSLRFRLGQFDPPALVPYSKIDPSENDCPAHQKLSLEAARQSLVLLKNDGVLFSNESRRVQGLKGEVFSKVEMTGEPASTRNDKQVDFFWAPAQPVPGIPLENANIRWSGVIIPKKTDMNSVLDRHRIRS